ncbi:hypothetical protein [uncultured Desulfobacter sp.]|uniref:hypothetical protein n=1 Tax=uncultured Desulfobacter sp. TaxID=240139 RepID=UPI0029F50A09|nr:hypothetical protein [uncultured Desulfobacter sp.]
MAFDPTVPAAGVLNKPPLKIGKSRISDIIDPAFFYVKRGTGHRFSILVRSDDISKIF